jgi:hypothetical protein
MKRFNIAREKFIRSRLAISEVICEADERAEDDYLRSRWVGGKDGYGRAMVREKGRKE